MGFYENKPSLFGSIAGSIGASGAFMGAGVGLSLLGTALRKPVDYNNAYTQEAKKYQFGGEAEQAFIGRTEKSKADVQSYFARTMGNTLEQNAAARQKQFVGQGIRSNTLTEEGRKADTARLTEQNYDSFSKYSLDADGQLNQGLLGLYGVGQGYAGLGVNVAQEQNKYDNRWSDMLTGAGDTAMGMGAGIMGQERGAADAKARMEDMIKFYKMYGLGPRKGK